MVSKLQNGGSSQIGILRLLIVLGAFAVLILFRWMVVTSIASPVWISGLLLASALFFAVQVVGNWIIYWFAARATSPTPNRRLSVDVFLTVYDEQHALIEEGIRAAVAMQGPHTTWLLDDSASPALVLMAERLGARYLTRPDRRYAKAGNLNWALDKTTGDVIAIFDIDHIPQPLFLEHSIGHFDDPTVGFVQVMLTFSNESFSWISRAAAESSLDFYNATSLGMDAIGGSTMMGSNSIIRRTALESIAGYRPGLAEDLATSLALHAAGWQSRYVAEPLAPGLAPPDLVAWFTQQVKWARGVFEVLLVDYPRLFWKLTPAQRLCYAIRMTKYWVGPFVAGHLVATFFLLWFQPTFATNVFNQYVLHLMPLVGVDFSIRYFAKRIWCEQDDKTKSLRRAVMLVYSSFPVYTLAWIMAICRLPLAFRSTPKTASGKLSTAWRFPIIVAMVAFFSGLVFAVKNGQLILHPYFIIFAALETIPIIVMFYHSLRLSPLTGGSKPETVQDSKAMAASDSAVNLTNVR